MILTAMMKRILRNSATKAYTIPRSKSLSIVQSRSYSSESKTSSDRPLYPSVELLLHSNNLKASDIQATGPGGRLLKGDVLAHLGKIPSSAPEAMSKHYTKYSHLDLSNIIPAAKEDKPMDTRASKTTDISTSSQPIEYELALPIDLKPILQLQQKLHKSLGHTPPLSELLARAIDLANVNLPTSKLSSDDLFNEILNSSRQLPPRVSNGRFVPFINAPAELIQPSRESDLFDELVAPPATKTYKKAMIPQPIGSPEEGAINDFSLIVPDHNRKRALVFLQRMKSILEIEPGRLVL